MSKKKPDDRGQRIGIRKDKNLTLYFLLLISCFLLLTPANRSFAVSEEAQIYFSAAKEEYIRGDFDSAISNIEKAIALDPENKRIKDFGSRIFYDGAKSLHLSRNYKKAFLYLEKAVKLNPGDARIRRLYDVTKDLLEREKSAVESRERVTTPLSARPPSEKEVVPVKRAPVRAPAAVKREVVPAPPAETPIIPSADAEHFIMLAASFSLSVIMIITAFFLFLRIRKLKKEISHKLAELKDLKSEKTKIIMEFEKTKESLKYEQGAVLKLQREIKDERAIKNKHLEQQLKLSMDIRHKQVEEFMKSAVKDKGLAGIHTRQAKVCELIGDATCIDEDSSTSLDSIRERIAAQVEDLYKTSPSSCLEFLNGMASNPNPLIRANIVKALTNLTKPETLEMLFKLNKDPIEKVKREALKEIKNLKAKVESGEVVLSRQYLEKIDGIIKDEKSSAEWIF